MTAEDVALTTLDRHLQSVDQLLSHLKFVPMLDLYLNSRRDLDIVDAFRKAIELYLKAPGHPPETRDTTVHKPEWESVKNDELFRARLMMRTCMATDIVPIGEWRILVCYTCCLRLEA